MRTESETKAIHRAVMSRLRREKPLTMSVEDLAAITDLSRNAAYAAIRNAVYPSVRQGRIFKVLVEPTLAILSGQRPAGPLPGETPPEKKRRRPPRKRVARKKKPVKSKLVTRRGEVAPPVPS